MFSMTSLHHNNSPALPLLVLSLLVFSPPWALSDDGYPPSKPIVTPIHKDSSFYTIPIKDGAPLVLDLAGSLLWTTSCPPSHRPVPYNSSVCKVANRNLPPNCASSANSGAQPSSACTAHPYNPASDQCGTGDITTVPLSANATDGKSPLFPVSFSTYVACAPDGLLASSPLLPSAATGVAGLSRMPLSLPSQVATRLKVAKEFALCLPSSGETGAAIFGGGPFELPSFPPGIIDFADEIRKNPIRFLKNRKNGAYYFGVQGIAVNQARVPVEAGAFRLDRRQGTGGVVLSTVTPYTTLRSDIYGAVINAFDAATSGMPRRKPVPPFQLCYESSAFTSTRLGPGVANIDLMLDGGGGRNWTLPGASSLVQVDPATLCFAFDMMGTEQSAAFNSPAIIFGAYQMEDNLMLFDLEKSTFGSSGLLLGMRTRCGNFATGSS